MQLWNSHNPFRACFISNDGYIILWDYKGLNLLSSFNPLVKEVRNSASMFYFANGDKTKTDAENFAKEIKGILLNKNKSANRLAVDKIQIHGLRALEGQGLDILDGEEVMERTRAIKGDEEIKAMRCAIHSCEMGMHEMRKHCLPGVTENDVWAVLHSENIKRGGEWIETRLLSSGQRTNPWFQECGPRVIQNNEIFQITFFTLFDGVDFTFKVSALGSIFSLVASSKFKSPTIFLIFSLFQLVVLGIIFSYHVGSLIFFKFQP